MMNTTPDADAGAANGQAQSLTVEVADAQTSTQKQASSPTSEKTEDSMVLVEKKEAWGRDRFHEFVFDKAKDETKEEFVVGMICDKKDLYEKIDARDYRTWSETIPEDLEKAAENEETQKFAILVRNRKSGESHKSLEMDSIVIQSPLLKKVLHEVLKDYPDVTTGLRRLVFSAPFEPFLHRWPQLEAALQDESLDAATHAHLQLLHGLLAIELGDVLTALQDYAVHRVIDFKHVWAILQPGSIMLTTRFGHPSATRAVKGQYTSHPGIGPCYELQCERVGFDGKFGIEGHCQYIAKYGGTAAVHSLDVFPLAHHPETEAIQAALEARGRTFEKLAGVHYRAYSGAAFESTECGPQRVMVNGRVMVDALTYSTTGGRIMPLRPLEEVKVRGPVQDEDEMGGPRCVRRGPRIRQQRNGYEIAGAEATALELQFREQAAMETGGEAAGGVQRSRFLPLTPQQLLLCTPMVKGFDLRSKKWLEFHVEQVADVSFNELAFDRLVLPKGHKKLILALTQSQIQNGHRFDDIIAGKGRGIVMLLSGGPGIGKTLTAESVADVMRVPLYVLSASDMGSDAIKVEKALENAFRLVAKWKAVLLIDECDVVLEARDVNNLQRNGIVSIFLRTLEYYQGVLFLTTNRLANIDPAFHSRIHVNLHYPELDSPARRSIWDGFLAAVGSAGHSLTAPQLESLASLSLNGRQIKNVLKTSGLLAIQSGQSLTCEHIRTVLLMQGMNV